MTEKFYKLCYTFDRFEECCEGVNTDGWIEEFEGYNDLKNAFFDCAKITIGGEVGIAKNEVTEDGIWQVLTAQVPESINFEVTNDLLRETDYPHMEHVDSWPIMSKRMVDVLLSVGDFPHQIIPITFVDSWDKSEAGIRHDYVILHLNQLSDFLDRDKAVYSECQSIADPSKIIIDSVDKTILKEPADGFPPIFRIKWNSTFLFVSSEAKIALEAAGIKGVRIAPFWEPSQL